MDCPFCNFDQEIKSRLLRETEHFYLIPALGAFIEGYLFIVSKEHFIGLSVLPRELINELTALERDGVKFLKVKYRTSVIEYEHGSCLGGTRKGGSCMEHFHFGLVATNKDIRSLIVRDLGEGVKIRRLRDLPSLQQEMYSYLLYKKDKEILYWKDPAVISQYIRRLLVEPFNSRYFDWRCFLFLENMEKLKAKWREYVS